MADVIGSALSVLHIQRVPNVARGNLVLLVRKPVWVVLMTFVI